MPILEFGDDPFCDWWKDNNIPIKSGEVFACENEEVSQKTIWRLHLFILDILKAG